jgi:integrase
MSLYRRSDSEFYWYDFSFGGRRYWGSTKQRNVRAAETHERILKVKLANSRSGIVEHKPVPLLRDFAREFLERTKNEMRPETWRGYRVALGLRVGEKGKLVQREEGGLLASFGSKRLDEITADEIERFKQRRLEQGRSAPTVNRDLGTLRRILLYAVKLDLIPTTPFVAHKVKFLRENGRERILSFEEERRYLAAATQPLRDVATLILEIGLRPGEVFSIRREDVHFYAAPPFVHIPFGKTKNAVRDVPMTARAKEVLSRRAIEAQNKNGQCIFPLRVGNGHDWSQPMNEIEPAHLAALRESKISSPFRPYDLRHTYGTRAIEGGTDPLTLMRLMGHADLKTTSRYVHLSKSHLAEAQAKIERYRAEREIAEAEAWQNTPVVRNGAVQ